MDICPTSKQMYSLVLLDLLMKPLIDHVLVTTMQITVFFEKGWLLIDHVLVQHVDHQLHR
jgi:hypothetical protein